MFGSFDPASLEKALEILVVGWGGVFVVLAILYLASLLLAAQKFAGAQAEQMTIPDRSSIWVHDGYDEDVTGCDYGYESERLRVFLYGE